MIETMKVNAENMLAAAKGGFINATDLADYLTKRGMPFRTAYKTVGTIVGDCIRAGKDLEALTLEEYKKYSDVFESDLYAEISLSACIAKRISAGGTGYDSVDAQIAFVEKFLND